MLILFQFLFSFLAILLFKSGYPSKLLFGQSLNIFIIIFFYFKQVIKILIYAVHYTYQHKLLKQSIEGNIQEVRKKFNIKKPISIWKKVKKISFFFDRQITICLLRVKSITLETKLKYLQQRRSRLSDFLAFFLLLVSKIGELTLSIIGLGR